MNAPRLALSLAAALPLMAAMPALAHGHDACCSMDQQSMTAAPKASASPKAAPTKPNDCCSPAPGKQPAPCCSPLPGGKSADCCPPGAHSQAPSQEQDGMKGMKGMHGEACPPGQACPPPATSGKQGDCCAEEGMHGDMSGQDGMSHDHAMSGMENMPGMHAHMAWMAAQPFHMGGEVRYAPGTSNLTLAWNKYMGMTKWYSFGMQGNYAWQVTPSSDAPNSHWFSPYFGVVPRVGTDLGPVRVDLGALLGLGAMLRTDNSQLLQLRAMWAVEPRIELGLRNDHMGVSLVGTYLFSPNPADLGGPSLGLQWTFSGAHWGGHHAM